MSRANVLALVTDLSYGLATPDTVAAYYHDLTWDATRWGVPSVAVLVETIKDDGTYALPDNEGKTYGVFYDDILLSLASLNEMQAVNANWRDERGRPRALIVQDEPEHDVTVYPVPDVDAQDFIFLFGSPFGRDFPARAIAALIGDRRDDLPEWLNLPLALAVLSREYERDSAHRDAAFAQACRTIGDTLLALLVPR